MTKIFNNFVKIYPIFDKSSLLTDFATKFDQFVKVKLKKFTLIACFS